MRNLKKLVTGLAVATGLVASAPAALADGYVGAKGRAPVYVAPVNWGGLYFGGHLGGAWTDISRIYDQDDHFQLAGNTYSHDMDGWIAGGQIGLAHQFGAFVAGVEISISGGDLHDKQAARPGGVTDPVVIEAKTQFITTVAAKFGYAWDSWLAYAKVGYAGAHIVSGSEEIVAPLHQRRTGEWHNGWMAGVGLSYMFRDHISIGVEYNWIALEGRTHHAVGDAGFAPPAFMRHNIDDSDIHTVTARINFHLHRGGHDAKPLK